MTTVPEAPEQAGPREGGTAPSPRTRPTTTASLRVRMNRGDAYYGGDLVEGAKILRLFGDLVTEITIREDGDEGLLSNYSDVHFTAPVAPGDYLEVRGSLVHRTRLRRVVQLSAVKVITSETGARASAARVLPEPEVVCTATATTVVPVGAARKRAAK